ncbi:Pyruvate dehydrogenase [NADP(+)], mitochondrial [Symbiodinium microadriaticum]|uniref:Pyruvate dehydrogenase [NADP(+)], mitochondrial n=1 Tax=Symbiodinium microadriaticum TaxID=2951 RepID=A0A1Q9DZG0_SYMMI|nr:Pyruvate dehydrogenase [NADP(+)], mitochondrial [Symbiodinium microadriaticum]
MAPAWWRNLGTQFDISSIYAVAHGARFPPDEATVKGKDLLLKTDVGAAHILDPNVGLGINYAVMAWHWTMVLVFMVTYFGIVALTTSMHEGIPWLTLVQKLLVFWNMWEALGLGVISGPMHAKVNPPFQDWWYRWTVGTMKYNAPFLPCLPNRRNYLDVLVEGVLMYLLTVRVLVSPEVTPALMWSLTACLIYEFLFDYGQHMHTYGTQTMYCFFCMCFTVEQGQVAGLQLFTTWYQVLLVLWLAMSLMCKIGPWFKYLNVSNLWSAKYMVSMPWSDWYRRVMYKGYKDSDPDYHLTLVATFFSAACAVSETLGPMLVLSNNDSVVTFGIIFICCMHLYIISTLIMDAGASSQTPCRLVRSKKGHKSQVFTWNFVDALLYIFLFGCYGPAVGGLRQSWAIGGPMGLQWHDVPKIHPAMAAFLLAHALYSVYGNFVPSHVARMDGRVASRLGFHLLMAYCWFWNLPNRMLLPLTFDQLQVFGGREVAASAQLMFVLIEDFIMLHSVLVFDALAAHVRFDGLSSLALVRELGTVCGFEEGECTLCWVGGFQSFPVQLFSDPSAMWKVVDSKKGLLSSVVREGTYTVQVPDDDLVELLLEEEELMRLNDSGHWQAVKEAMTRALSSLAPGSFVQLLDISDALPLSLLLAPELCAAASRWDAVCCLRSRAEKQALLSLIAESSLDADRVHILLASAQQLIQAALPSPFPPNGAGAEATLQSTPSASLIICEDIVGASGALRAEALEDLSLLWRTCSGRHGRELRVVPEAIVLKLSLIESDELERRTRVVERPGGVDVSEVNALSVSDFLSLEESLLKPRCLCKEVEALSLPLGPSLLTALAALSARENGAPLLRLRLTAESSGKVHGIVTRFAWPGSAGQSWDKRLAGVVWPCEGRNRPPHLEVGDSVVVTVGYTPARGLVVTPVCLERGVPAAPRENKKCVFAGHQVGCKASNGVGMWAAISAQQLRGQVSPFGPYGGLAPAEERTTEHPERLASLNAGVADFEYEQFLKAKEVQRAMFKAENKTIVHQNADTDVIQASEGSIACIDGNQAAAHVAYALSDCAFIYPITPSSPMGEMVDEWAAQGLINCYGQKLSVTEMQSEAGAAGALHGALKAGALSTTFTASQGLLLMIPNMFKIAGELLPCVMHVAARALAGQALSIFGDHSDVMACRSTGWAMLASESVEMVQYNALVVAHLVSMERRVPVQHFFDGFRTSHEVNKVKLVDYKTMKDFVNWDAIKEHHDLAMNPRHPHVQGTSQGPDIFFQCVEAGNTFYDNLADLFEAKSRLVEQKTGVHYALYAYEGHPEATNVIVVMGSGAVTCSETAKYLHDKGEKVGVLKVRLFRPWEPGSQGEPLFLEVSSTLQLSGRADIICIGGRYGLGSKEFTPNMVLSIYENLAKETPKPRFTVGINDDVTNLSLPVGDWLDVLPQGTTECMFYGLGSDGTVGANKSAVKMIALGTELYAQAYFEYDAKKSGGVTISHLRFGPKPIHAPYNVRSANYLAVHKSSYVTNYDMTRYLKPNGVCVINCSWTPAELEKRLALQARITVLHLPAKMRRDLATKQAKLYWAKLYIIDATQIAVKAGLGKRINMIMQSVFFKLSGVMPYEEAIEMLKKSIKKMYGKKGDAVVKMNIDGVDASVTGIVECPVPSSWASLTVEEQSDESSTLKKGPRTIVDMTSDQFAKQVQSHCNNLDGNALPVSTFVPGGRVPLGTSQYEKRGIAINVPTVDMDKCTQCNKCSLICPHAAVRPFLATTQELSKAPQDFRAGSRAAIGGGVLDNYQYRIQVSPWDCTGCELCVRICPADALKLSPAGQVIQQEEPNWNFAVTLPDRGNAAMQFQKPYLEFSGACEGCGETPHVKLMTQLFGERLVIANATGCSSIWGGSNPSFPYTVNSKGEGPAWANSLFEDNAEFGFGMRKAFKQRRDYLAMQVEDALGDKTVIMSDELRQTLQQYLVMRKEQMHDLLLPRGRSIYHQLMEKLEPLLSKEKDSHPKLKYLHDLEDMFGRSSFWMVGGDGWAYDIGYGGLDHVIASEEHVNILVLDTEMYSNTGGQASKSTPKGAMAKFAEGGKLTAKKDMGQLAMTYKNVYVASICVHVNPQQAVRAMLEADAYAGPSIILAYSPCISQGFPMAESIQHCQMAVDSGYWPLYRYNPEAAAHGNNPFQLDSKKIKGDLFKFLAKENRFAAVMRRDPKHAQELDDKLKEQLVQKNHLLQVLNKDDLEGQFHKLVEGLSDASSAGNSVTILYGSETGNSEEQAKNLMQDIMARGLKATCTAMDDFDFEELPNQKIVILVVSTCGLGEYPANCKQTWMKLQSQELPMSWLSGTKFAVFGLGDSTYSQFCVAAIGFDTRLGELGAQRMLKRGVGDDRDEDRYYTGWEAWLPELWQVGSGRNKVATRGAC